MAEERRTYEYQGKRYSLPASLSPAEAKAKIQASLTEQAAEAPVTAGRTERDSGFMDKLRGSARELVTGMTLEFGDEAGAAIAATIAKATGDDKSWGDIYEDIKGTEAYERDRFREENPALAIGSNIVGAVASPVSLVAPGSGLARATGRAAAEAGVAGFGAGEGGLEERAGQAASDAVTGALLGGTIGALTRRGRRLSTLDVDTPLQQGDQFTPITEFADQLPANTKARYESAKASIPGRKMMQAQYEPLLRQARQRVEDASGGVDPLLRGTGRVGKEAEEAAGTMLRGRFVEESMPNALKRSDPALAERIRNASPGDAMSLMDDWYTGSMFEDAKKIAYQVDDVDDMADRIYNRLDPELVDGRISRDWVRKQIDAIEEDGMIPGNAMVQLRSKIGQEANALVERKGKAALDKGALFQLKGAVDDEILPQLRAASSNIAGTPALRAEFLDQIDRYGTYKATQNLQREAFDKGRPGSFSPNLAMKQGSSSQRRTGSFPMYEESAAAGRAKQAASDEYKRATKGLEEMLKRAPNEGADSLQGMIQTGLEGRVPALVLGALGLAGAGAPGLAAAGIGFPIGMARSGVRATRLGQRAYAGQTAAQEQMRALEQIYQNNPQAKALIDALRLGLQREAVVGE